MRRKYSVFLVFAVLVLLLVSCDNLDSNERSVVTAVVSVADRFKDPSSVRITTAWIRSNGDIDATISARNSFGGIVSDSYRIKKTSYGYSLGEKIIIPIGDVLITDVSKVNSAIEKELSKKYSR